MRLITEINRQNSPQYLSNPYSRDPSLHDLRVVGAQELYKLYTLRLLQPRVFDGETVVRGRLVLLAPVDPEVHLVGLEGRQTDQLFEGFSFVFR